MFLVDINHRRTYKTGSSLRGKPDVVVTGGRLASELRRGAPEAFSKVLEFNPALAAPNSTLVQIGNGMIEITADHPESTGAKDQLSSKKAERSIRVGSGIRPGITWCIAVDCSDLEGGRMVVMACQGHAAGFIEARGPRQLKMFAGKV